LTGQPKGEKGQKQHLAQLKRPGMELWTLTNKLTRHLEFFLITFVVFFYLMSLYDTVTSSSVFLPAYLLLTSFYYYTNCLSKPPGHLLDFNNANIKGICKKCNRIVGSRTVHCETCNKCYFKRDHHCPVIGKCIASDNFNDLYYTALFMMLYCILAVARTARTQPLVFVYKYLIGLLSAFLLWLTLLVVVDKTSKEILKEESRMSRCDFKVGRLRHLLDDGVLFILLPFLRWKTSAMP
jgi:hypothetical protein